MACCCICVGNIRPSGVVVVSSSGFVSCSASVADVRLSAFFFLMKNNKAIITMMTTINMAAMISIPIDKDALLSPGFPVSESELLPGNTFIFIVEFLMIL